MKTLTHEHRISFSPQKPERSASPPQEQQCLPNSYYKTRSNRRDFLCKRIVYCSYIRVFGLGSVGTRLGNMAQEWMIGCTPGFHPPSHGYPGFPPPPRASSHKYCLGRMIARGKSPPSGYPPTSDQYTLIILCKHFRNGWPQKCAK